MSYLRILPLTLAQSLTLPQPLTPYLTLNLSGLEAACALLVHLGAGRDAVDGNVEQALRPNLLHERVDVAAHPDELIALLAPEYFACI